VRLPGVLNKVVIPKLTPQNCSKCSRMPRKGILISIEKVVSSGMLKKGVAV
jgi:hypothetical protein